MAIPLIMEKKATSNKKYMIKRDFKKNGVAKTKREGRPTFKKSFIHEANEVIHQ